MGTSSTHSINPAIYSDLPYDPVNDFVPVSNVVISPLVLVAHPSFPARSVTTVVAAAKREGGRLLIASPGQGTSQHMAIELLAARAGVKLEAVQYKGSGPALIDTIGGQVHLMMDSVASALPQIKAGTIRPIAVATARRIPQLPDVPTISESGYPGFESFGWAGVLLPRGTPRELVEQLSTEIQEILRQPALAAEIIARGSIPDPRSPEDFANFIRADTVKWKELSGSAGLHLQR
jgi:tripartite-type tricarboxylate transporter receptor subunit TctC